MNYYAKQIAVLVTATVTVMVVIALCLITMTWPGEGETPKGPDPYIELVEDEAFVEPVLDPMPRSHTDADVAAALTQEDIDRPSQVAPTTGTSVQDRGEQGEPARVVTQTAESSVKTKAEPQPDRRGTVKPKPDVNAQTEKRTNNQVSNAFAAAGKNNANNAAGDEGRSGSRNGRADATGSAHSRSTKSGVGGRSLGGGWVWPHVSNQIKADKTGSVIVEFVVDPAGHVIKADAVGGEAPASTLYGARCEQIVLALKFSRTDGEVLDHNSTGRITFTFR